MRKHISDGKQEATEEEHDDVMKPFYEYMSKVKTKEDPETEEEFIITLEFLIGYLLEHEISKQASQHDKQFGIISHDAEIDMGKVIVGFRPGVSKKISSIITLACEKFDLMNKPTTDSDDVDKMTFEDWFNISAEKYNRPARYEKEIFDGIKTAATMGK